MPVSVESSLHAALKSWYFQEGDLLEHQVEGYIIDIVRDSLLIEIQTGNFSKIKSKLYKLLPSHKIHLVYPIPHQKWIVKQTTVNDKTRSSRRKSPKRGKLDHLFNELVFIPNLLKDSNFSLEILITNQEEIRIHDGKGSWRRQGWSILDRILLEVIDTIKIDSPEYLLTFFKNDLAGKVTTTDLAVSRNISTNLARKIIYCFTKMDLLTTIGKKGRSNLYILS